MGVRGVIQAKTISNMPRSLIWRLTTRGLQTASVPDFCRRSTLVLANATGPVGKQQGDLGLASKRQDREEGWKEGEGEPAKARTAGKTQRYPFPPAWPFRSPG